MLSVLIVDDLKYGVIREAEFLLYYGAEPTSLYNSTLCNTQQVVFNISNSVSSVS